MKEILAFGDSLTWGADPASGGRHPFASRWPTTLAAALQDVRVTAEGLGGRTTVFDDPTGPTLRSGARDLPTALGSHQPLDLVILMLGTNDLKPFICGTAQGAHAGMKRLVQIVRTYAWRDGRASDVMIVAPPPCVNAANGMPAQNRSIAESLAVAPLYRALAAETGCAFFDAGSFVSASPLDGVHMDAENTALLGRAMAPTVAERLGLQLI